MDPIFVHLGVHLGMGTIARSLVIALGLRYFTGRWQAWDEILAAALSAALLRALLGEGINLLWGFPKVVPQMIAASAVVLLQIATLRLVTDHERETISLTHIALIALAAQLSGYLVSGPISRTILDSF